MSFSIKKQGEVVVVDVEGQLIVGNRQELKQKVLDEAQSVWIEAKLICEVQFACITEDGLLREPVFLRLRPDLSSE